MTSGDEEPRIRRDAGGGAVPGDAPSGNAGFGDSELADALRGMFSGRADRVQTGATWRPPEAGAGRRWGPARPGRVPARRWLLPAAAAAVVVALVVTVITVRGPGSPAGEASAGPTSAAAAASAVAGGSSSGTSAGTGTATAGGLAPAPAPVAQRPVPSGMQAVDALGVEIFVSTSLTLDPPCDGNSVSRPAYGLTYAIGCVALRLPAVWIISAAAAATWNDPPASGCANSVRLQDEAGCLTVTGPAPNTDPEAVTATIVWPRHDVAVIAEYPAGQREQALSVVASAHWVPVDRNGCAATRSPVVPASAASLPDGPVLPADATSTSACWYSGRRLVASATLPPDGAQDLQHPGPPGNAPGIGVIPTYAPSPDRPACSVLGRTEGIVFQSTRPDGSIAVSAAQFADCEGGQYWTDGTHAQPVDEALASAVRRLAGFLLVFGYRAAAPDPETSAALTPPSNGLPDTAAGNGSVTSSTDSNASAAPTTWVIASVAGDTSTRTAASPSSGLSGTTPPR